MAISNTNTKRTSTSGVSKRDPKQTDRLDNTPAIEPIQSEQQTEKTGAISTTSAHNPGNAFAPDKPSNSSDTSGTGVTPSVCAGPTGEAQNTQNTKKQQDADRPCEELSGREGDVVRDSKQETGNAQKVDTSDQGSKAFAEAHRDAANKASEGGDDDLRKSSLGNGTGKKYVMSTGVSADGGDFDAAKPGAGKEADRKNSRYSNLRIHSSTNVFIGLLGEKGVQRGGGSSDSLGKLAEKANKLSLGDKIKAKLHKN
jgi:hypothetical protein